MVGHYKGKDCKNKDFKVGVVKGADGHKFDFNVYTPGSGEACHKITLPEKGAWIFEVTRNGVPIPRDIEKWSLPRPLPVIPSSDNQVCPIDIPQVRDFSSILDIEIDLHKKGLGKRGKPFNRIFHFYNGNIKAESVTSTLRIIRMSKPEENPINRLIGEVAGVEINLRPDEHLVMKDKKSNTVLWENVYGDSEVVEGRIINLPYNPHDPDFETRYCNNCYLAAATPCPNDPKVKVIPLTLREFLSRFFSQIEKLSEDCPNKISMPEETHFQFYYRLVFNVKPEDRFELTNPCPVCYKVTDDRKASKGDAVILTVPPYRCGMVLAGKKDVD